MRRLFTITTKRSFVNPVRTLSTLTRDTNSINKEKAMKIYQKVLLNEKSAKSKKTKTMINRIFALLAVNRSLNLPEVYKVFYDVQSVLDKKKKVLFKKEKALDHAAKSIESIYSIGQEKGYGTFCCFDEEGKLIEFFDPKQGMHSSEDE